MPGLIPQHDGGAKSADALIAEMAVALSQRAAHEACQHADAVRRRVKTVGIAHRFRGRQRRPGVAAILRQMKRAGVEASGVEIGRDGTVRIVAGKPVVVDNNVTDHDRNEWDTVQ